MLFSFKRIFHNIKSHLGVYAVFALQFAVGVVILGGSLTVLFSLKNNLRAEQQKLSSSEVDIYCEFTMGIGSDIPVDSWKERAIIDYELYADLVERYGDEITFKLALDMQSGGPSVRNNETGKYDGFLRYHVWFINDAKFEAMFGVPMEEGKMYAGETAYEALVKYRDVYAKDPEKYFMEYHKSVRPLIKVENGEFISTMSGNTYALERMPETDIERLMPTETFYDLLDDEELLEQFRLVYTVFLPISEYKAYGEYLDAANLSDEECNIISAAISAEYKDAEFDVNLLPEVLNYMTSESSVPGMKFSANQALLDLQRYAEMVENQIADYFYISASVLTIVMLGTTGLFLIFLYRRKKQMAVAIAYGSTKQRLFAELFCEIFIITGAGAVLGLCAMQLLMPLFIKVYAQAVFDPACIYVAIGAAALSALASTTLAFLGVGEIAPARILKDL